MSLGKILFQTDQQTNKNPKAMSRFFFSVFFSNHERTLVYDRKIGLKCVNCFIYVNLLLDSPKIFAPFTNISPSSISVTKSLKAGKTLSVIDVISSIKTGHQTSVYNSSTSGNTIMTITPSRASVPQATSFVSVPITTKRLPLSPTFQVMFTTSCFLYLVFSKSKSGNIRVLSSGLCQGRTTNNH